MYFIDAILSLFKNTIIKNYQESKIIINLFFATQKIVNKLISCEIIHEIKNSFDYLFINIIFNLKAQKKSKR